jgi:hypothetical protein
MVATYKLIAAGSVLEVVRVFAGTPTEPPCISTTAARSPAPTTA